GLMLTWTLMGDRVAEVLAVAPLVLVFGCRAVRGLVRRGPRREAGFDAAMTVAAAAAYGLSVVIGRLVAALGGFRLLPVKLQAASSLQIVGENVGKTADGVLALFGAEFYQYPPGVPMILSLVHLAGLGLAVAAVLTGIWRFARPSGRSSGRPEDPLVGVLTAGFVINIAVYVLSTMPVTIWSTREIAGVLPAGAVLAGRVLGGPLARWMSSGRPRIRFWLRPLAAVVAVAYLAALGYGTVQRQLPAEGQNLADWLTARHLANGLTGYGYGPTTTLASGGRVQLRQAEFSYRRATPGPEEQQQSWYDPRRHDATFLVLASQPGPFADLTPAQARRIFGRPARVYRVGREFRVWTYRGNLLSRVR
ncbi:MAG: hypothetical protein FWE35_20250, partial [Streptosporangiales bacterium]|nr:hypothetical protein [Streptosporangiales bacterium]